VRYVTGIVKVYVTLNFKQKNPKKPNPNMKYVTTSLFTKARQLVLVDNYS